MYNTLIERLKEKSMNLPEAPMLFFLDRESSHDEVWKPRKWPDTIQQQAVFDFIGR